jgi:hypothetical protein
MISTAIRRSEILARAAALDWAPVACNGVALANEAAWRARIGGAFDLELAAVAVQLDALEAAAAVRSREAEPGTAELLRAGAPMQSAAEYAEVVRERERRQQHAEAEFARRERALKSKQLDDAGIE